MATLNESRIRQDFPFFKHKKAIYFDNACMTLRPKQVINAMLWYYEKNSSCADRSLHSLGTELSEKLKKAREEIMAFFNADQSYELVFTKNTTEAINLAANGYPFKKGEKVILSEREHNSNLVPWLLQKHRGIKCLTAKCNKEFEFDLEAFKKMLGRKTGIVSVTHAGNVDGYKMPVKEIIKTAHDQNAKTFIDAAQATGHTKIDLKKINADFIAISSHKACGPVAGCLIAKKQALSQLKPVMFGGGAVIDSNANSFRLEGIPKRFEAGLQDYAGMLGFAEACNYLKKISMQKIEKKGKKMRGKIVKTVKKIPESEIIGVSDSKKCIGIASFYIKGIDSLDIAMHLDEARKIEVRAGEHCAHAWFSLHKLPSAVRVSPYFYNSHSELKAFESELEKIAKIIK